MMPEPILNLEQFSTLVDGLDHPEGVAWGSDSNWYAGGEAGQIYRISPQGELSQFATTGGFILGIALDADHNIYACDLGDNTVKKISFDGTVTLYSEGAPNRKFVAPNFPVFTATGELYVSSSGEFKGKDGCVFLIRPGGETIIASTEIDHFPNGMALSPDGKELFIVLSNMPGIVKATIRADGTLGSPSVVVEMPATVPDGIALDSEENLYITCYSPNRVYRYTTDGKLELLASDWESVVLSAPTNIAFGGDKLRYAIFGSLGRWHLSIVEMPIVGAPIHYPKMP